MLTELQRTTLATHVRTSVDVDVVAALAARNDTELARLYNLDTTFIVWREAVQPEEYREAMDWTEVDNMTVGKARIWEWITQDMTVPYDATKQNVRAGLNNALNGTSETQMIAVSKEAASILEEIYATGTGTDIDPGIRVVVGDISVNEMSQALNENP